MAFEYHSENGNTLTSPQEELLEMIENLPSPFEGISRLKDLRAKIKLEVHVLDSKAMLEPWESYMNQYEALHDVFYGGEHWQACHVHQGEIGERRDYVYWQIKKGKEPENEFVQEMVPILGLYTRTYYWWRGTHRPKIGLMIDNIRNYAHENCVNEDIVFGFVFIQLMMHAYFSAFNGEGYPSILSLENSFAEAGMFSFIDNSPTIGYMLPDARYYVASRIGTRPWGFGYGADLFDLAGTGSVRMINRYKDISNWTDWNTIRNVGIDYCDVMREYEKDPSKQNALKVYRAVEGILDIDWRKPLDPIQPAIGKVGFFAKSDK